MRIKNLVLVAAALNAAACGLAAPSLAASSFSTIFRFGGGVTGSFPDAALTIDAAGNLYGTTYQGGVAGLGGCGAVFKLSAVNGKTLRGETILHHFDCADGRNPDAPLLLGSAGTLYGTTYNGGSNDLGVVFEVVPPAAGATKWVETVLYSFTGKDGENPVGSLVRDESGSLYGVTENGGANLSGNVFKLTPPAAGSTKWTESTILSFDYATGNFPLAGLVMDKAGTLYGTTAYNGPNDTGGMEGVVFKLTPTNAARTTWSYAVLHEFGVTSGDGNSPESDLIIDSGGALYGTTTGGGAANSGTVFKLTPPTAGKTTWTETLLYGFSGGADGTTPFAALVLDKTGALYSTTTGGNQHDGNIFKLTPPAKGKTAWTFSSLHDFDFTDGDYPAAGLTFTANGTLVGTTSDGGSGYGTTFSLLP